jgi:hypothetical protein
VSICELLVAFRGVNLTCSTCHHVQCLVFSIIRSRKANHWARIIANNDNLAAGGKEVLITNATQELGRKPGAIYNDIGLLTRVVCVRGVGDMLENGSLEDCAFLGALPN